MKKFLFGIFAVAALSLGFVSCDDDDDIDRGTHKTGAASAFAGEYAGLWTIISSDGVTIEKDSIDGSVIVAASDTAASIVNITLTCADITAINGKSTDVNISWKNSNAKFSNPLSSNGIGTLINGEISGDGQLDTKFSLSVRSGRSTVTKFYKFTGNK